MKKINESRLAQLKTGEVVLYTGDKKGSEEVEEVLNRAECAYIVKEKDFYGLNEITEGVSIIEFLNLSELNNRPIKPAEWFYETEDGWISIEDRLPEFDGEYLCIVEEVEECGERYERPRILKVFMNAFVLDFDNQKRVIKWRQIPYKP